MKNEPSDDMQNPTFTPSVVLSTAMKQGASDFYSRVPLRPILIRKVSACNIVSAEVFVNETPCLQPQPDFI